MLTFEEARNKAAGFLQKINKKASSNDYECVLIDSATETLEFGWIFFYQNRKYLETGDSSFALAGNAPLLLDRTTGLLHPTGTARSLDHYLANYRLTGDPHREPVWHLTFTPAPQSAKSREVVCLFRDLFELPLFQAKQVVDSLLEGTELTFQIGAHERALQISSQFHDLGFPSTLNVR